MTHPNIDNLNEYIKKVRDVPFQWHVNDCFTFTNNAFHAMYGEGWADDWVGKYTKNGLYLKRDELRKAFGAQTLEQAIDEKLQRYDGIPPRGALVSTDKTRRWVIGQALGIAVGAKAIFLGETGVVSVYIEDIKNAWVKA
jgi:hypothetical protein